MPPRNLLGYLLGASWMPLGVAFQGGSWASWVPLGAVWDPLGGLLGASWVYPGASWGLLGVSWGPLGAIARAWLAPPGGPVELLRAACIRIHLCSRPRGRPGGLPARPKQKKQGV